MTWLLWLSLGLLVGSLAVFIGSGLAALDYEVRAVLVHTFPTITAIVQTWVKRSVKNKALLVGIGIGAIGSVLGAVFGLVVLLIHFLGGL